MEEFERDSFKNNFNKYFMETNKKEESDGKAGASQNKDEENKSKTESNQSNPFAGFAGFDFKSINIPEWALHLLTGIGAMGGNYFLWIKPMQDKMDSLNQKLNEQEKRIMELEHEQDDLFRIIKRDYDENGERKDEFFAVNREGKLGKSSRRGFTKM